VIFLPNVDVVVDVDVDDSFSSGRLKPPLHIE
jgi:hypothetical protein